MFEATFIVAIFVTTSMACLFPPCKWFCLAIVFIVSIYFAAWHRHESDRLRNLSTIDELTGLLVGSASEAHLVQELAAAKRSGRSLSILYCDANNFKTLNDRLGHQTGDRILQLIAKELTALCRAADIVGRLYRGDEFLVVLPDTEFAGAQLMKNRVFSKVQHQFRLPDGNLLVTLAIGVATYVPSERGINFSAKRLLEEGDRDMQNDKVNLLHAGYRSMRA